MPLNPKMSIADMVKELMASYKENGKIGSTKPRNKAHALNIALAIAQETKRKKK